MMVVSVDVSAEVPRFAVASGDPLEPAGGGSPGNRRLWGAPLEAFKGKPTASS